MKKLIAKNREVLIVYTFGRAMITSFKNKIVVGSYMIPLPECEAMICEMQENGWKLS